MPNEYTFNYIFDCAINGIKEHVPDKRKAVWFCEKLQSQKRGICGIYIDLRNAVKNRYMKGGEDEPLDRHKCAAVFMIALLHCMDIRDNNYNKERFGIFIGMLLLKIFIRKECRDIGNMGLLDFINNNGGLTFPPCVCDKNNYLHSWMTELYCARTEKLMFVLSVSNNLFMIETYNRQCAKIEGLASELKLQ